MSKLSTYAVGKVADTTVAERFLDAVLHLKNPDFRAETVGNDEVLRILLSNSQRSRVPIVAGDDANSTRDEVRRRF